MPHRRGRPIVYSDTLFLKALVVMIVRRLHQVGELLKPWARSGRAVALDSTVLRARGGVWHKKDKEAGVVPHSSIDTEAGWTYSGWHGWVYGWKLHLACTVTGVWIPLALPRQTSTTIA